MFVNKMCKLIVPNILVKKFIHVLRINLKMFLQNSELKLILFVCNLCNKTYEYYYANLFFGLFAFFFLQVLNFFISGFSCKYIRKIFIKQ